MEISSLDAVEMQQIAKKIERRQVCMNHMPKILFGSYITFATIATVLCLTTFRPALERFSRIHHSDSSNSNSLSFSLSSIQSTESDSEFALQDCGTLCSQNGNTWCCTSNQVCGSQPNTCDSETAAVGLIVGILIAIWFGPLFIYLLVIAFVRCSQLGRFQSMANSGQFQSWVIIGGCFQMSIDSSSGDAEFNQAAYNIANAYGGCGDECLMHCLGIACCGSCYPCCMCCVSAARNQSKVGTLQSGLSCRGYSAKVEFLSSIIPACCNFIFIGLIGRAQNVVVVTTGSPGASAVMFAPASAPPQVVQYAQPMAPAYTQYAQPQYLPAPQYGQPPASYAPAYSPAPAGTTASSQPPEVVKSS